MLGREIQNRNWAAHLARGITDQISNVTLEQRAELVRFGQTKVHLHLHPPELGQIQVHLTMDQEQVHARLVVREEITHHLVDGQLETLRQRLVEGGVNLGRFELAREGGGNQGRWAGTPDQFVQELVPKVKIAPARPQGTSWRIGENTGSLDVLA